MHFSQKVNSWNLKNTSTRLGGSTVFFISHPLGLILTVPFTDSSRLTVLMTHGDGRRRSRWLKVAELEAESRKVEGDWRVKSEERLKESERPDGRVTRVVVARVGVGLGLFVFIGLRRRKNRSDRFFYRFFSSRFKRFFLVFGPILNPTDGSNSV
ncbi:hypothetical protein J1N35_034365 [Gossypium stocksii]|uniref:Transmembrane protein n=1 Tax=Gossypium stocksii TaxID=47602 RepID=A0A9D3USF1_9ROSI|nr:hypothetical protein J1N35_034365 [Gossypium stocksii]